VDGEPTDPLSPHLHLARMHAGPDRQPGTRQGIADRAGAADGTTWPVEGGQEPVAGGVDLVSTEPCQLVAHDGVVLIKERAPAGITECGGSCGGVHDVGEEDGGEPSVRVR
jgi:hypothetical protein